MASRRLGYIPDQPDDRDLDFEGWSLASSNLPAKFSIRQKNLVVLDQQTASMCVGFGTAQAVLTAERYVGVELELPSQPFIYYNARRLSSGLFMTDSGTSVRAAMEGLQKLGACPSKLWPFSTNSFNINRRPPWAAYMGAYARRGGEYRRIFATGDARLLAIKTAIFAGCPVVFGTQVGESFMNSGGSEIIGPPHGEPIAGGHCMMLDGWEDVPGHGTLFDDLNSWGITWRNGGACRLTAEYMTWINTLDLWCVRGWQAMKS